MRNVYEVIGSFSYANIRERSVAVNAHGEWSSHVSSPKPVRVVHTANFLAEDAEEAIFGFKMGLDDFAEEHHYANGGDRWLTELIVSSSAIESVALLAVGVHE